MKSKPILPQLPRRLTPFNSFFLALAIELILIWWVYPSPNDFGTIETMTGIYTFDGHRKSRSYLKFDTGSGRRELLCSPDFVGGASPCGMEHLDKQIVTVQLVRYRHLFGEQDVLVGLSTKSNVHISYNSEALVSEWLRKSIYFSILYAFIFAMNVYVIRVSKLITR